MLNLISNDLDFLLNRRHEVPLPTILATSECHPELIHQQLPKLTPPPPAAFANQAKSSPLLLKHDVIMEESEHEVDS